MKESSQSQYALNRLGLKVQQVPRVNDILPAMQTIMASIQSTLGLEQVLQQICDAIVESLGYDNGVIWLHDEDRQVLRGVAVHTKDSPWLIDKVEGIIGQRIVGLELPARRDYSLSVRKTLDGEVCITHSLYEVDGGGCPMAPGIVLGCQSL